MHCTAVAEVAVFLARRMARRGTVVDRDLVAAAALLHDLDKALPDAHPLKALGHGAAGAAWLTERGYAGLAPAVAMHPVMRIGEAETYEAWADAAGLEGRVV